MPLKASQKKNLRQRAHHLKPLVTVAGKGLSESVIAEIARALNDHELIKVKLRGDRKQRETWMLGIVKQCDTELVQSIGQTACFYKKHPEKPVIDPG